MKETNTKAGARSTAAKSENCSSMSGCSTGKTKAKAGTTAKSTAKSTGKKSGK